MRMRVLTIALIAAMMVLPFQLSLADVADISTVSFLSADGHTKLVGYLFLPNRLKAKSPAVVLMHGRSGVYSSNAHGDYSARWLRVRDISWARAWQGRGYAVLIVDSFGPRGFPRGFPAGTHGSRPPEVDEVTVRPFDAYGALAYLQTRPEVAADRIGLMGWSNGASATLATLAVNGIASHNRTVANGFRVGLAFYPGCGLNGAFASGYRPYAHVKIFVGTDDEEISPAECQHFAAVNRQQGGGVDLTIYHGATHDFDDPLNHRQELEANAAANADAREQAARFFGAALHP